MEIDMSIFDEIELTECPFCGGPGVLEEESVGGWYAICADCGAQTASCDFKTPEERVHVAKKVAELWNMGKIVRFGYGD